MSEFRSYERSIVTRLTQGVLTRELQETILSEAKLVFFEYTGCGYFLTVAHPELPRRRLVCTRPEIIAEAKGVKAGFIVFIEDGELTLECHNAEDKDVLPGYRELEVVVVN